MREVIEDEITVLLGGDDLTPGSHTYLANYNTALKNVVDRLTPERRTELEGIAERWGKQGLPEDVQRRYVIRARDIRPGKLMDPGSRQ